jgi:hypothetical protein
MQDQDSEPVGQDDEGDLRWSTRSRCLAVLRELEAPLPDWETIGCLLAGGAEDVEAGT